MPNTQNEFFRFDIFLEKSKKMLKNYFQITANILSLLIDMIQWFSIRDDHLALDNG